MNTKRIIELEGTVKTFETKTDVKELEARMKEADAAQVVEMQQVESRRAAALQEVKRELEIRHGKAEEVAEQHWQHIRNSEELIRTKADREMVQVGFDQAAANLQAVDKRLSEAHAELVESSAAWQAGADERIASTDARVTVLEEEIKTKASVEETKELREKLALCCLRTEMRELLESLRQETSPRIRMLRSASTDRPRAAPSARVQNNDPSDKFDAGGDRGQPDKAAERWLEASQQLHGGCRPCTCARRPSANTRSCSW